MLQHGSSMANCHSHMRALSWQRPEHTCASPYALLPSLRPDSIKLDKTTACDGWRGCAPYSQGPTLQPPHRHSHCLVTGCTPCRPVAPEAHHFKQAHCKTHTHVCALEASRACAQHKCCTSRCGPGILLAHYSTPAGVLYRFSCSLSVSPCGQVLQYLVASDWR